MILTIINILLALYILTIIHKRWFNLVTGCKLWFEEFAGTPVFGCIMLLVLLFLITVLTILSIQLLGLVATFFLTLLIVYDILPSHFKNAWDFITLKFVNVMTALEKYGK